MGSTIVSPCYTTVECPNHPGVKATHLAVDFEARTGVKKKRWLCGECLPHTKTPPIIAPIKEEYRHATRSNPSGE